MATETFHVNDSEDALNSRRHSKGRYYSVSLTTIVIFIIFVMVAVAGLALGLGIPLSKKSSSSDEDTPAPPTTTTTRPPGPTTTTRPPGPTTTTAPTTTKPPIIDYPLPPNLVPFQYDILTTVQFTNTDGERFPYDGETVMHFECKENTKTIKFHANNLKVDNSSLELKSTSDTTFTPVTNFPWTYDEIRQFIIVDLNVDLKKGEKYTLKIKYIGYLQSDNTGFYRSSYTDGSGNKR